MKHKGFWFRKMQQGIEINYGERWCFGVSWLLPLEDLEVGTWNLIGLALMVGPVMVIGLELSKERLGLMILNCSISLIYDFNQI